MKEIWKDIEGYEGLYQVSSLGRVKSFDRQITYNTKTGTRTRIEKGKIRKQQVTNNYLGVQLKNNNISKPKRCNVHRLVAQAFIPNPDNLPCINHRDENKQNNHVDNLEWCTQKYNLNYGTRNEKVSTALTNRKDHSKPVVQLDMLGNTIEQFVSISEASRQTGILTQQIYQVCNGKAKSAKGFKFRYL